MPRIPNLFRSASLTRKLTMMLVGSSILTAAAVGIQTNLIADEDMRGNRVGRLQAVAENSAADIEHYLETVHSGLRNLAESALGLGAMTDLHTGWDQIDTTDPTVPEAPQQAAKPAVADGAAPPLRHAMGSGWSEFRA